MSRKSAREVVFKLIFENCFHKPEEGITYEEFLADFGAENGMPEDSMFFELKNKLDDKDLEYIKGVYLGVLEHSNEIKELISSKLVNYTTERLFKSDLAILIYSVYELKFTDEEVIFTGFIAITHSVGIILIQFYLIFAKKMFLLY